MTVTDQKVVKLKRPVDFQILEAFSDAERDLGANIAKRIDRNRGYVNTRLPQLEDYDLLTRIGPAENSGLYRITPRGVATLKLRGEYERDDYEELVDDRAEVIEIRPPAVVDHDAS